MEKRCVKSTASRHDPQCILYQTEDRFPVNFDVLETEAGDFLVSIVHGSAIHLSLISDNCNQSEQKTLTLRNSFDCEYKDVLLVARFGRHDGTQLLCAAGETGCIYLITLASFEKIDFWALRHHLKTVMDIRFTHKSRLLSASQDHSVILWDLSQHAVLCAWIDTASRLTAANQVVPTAADGLFLAGYDDGVVRGLDASTAEIVLASRNIVDANICAMEAVDSLLFVRSVTGRLAMATVDAERRRIVVVKVFNLSLEVFSYFDSLSVARRDLLLFGCKGNQWAMLKMQGQVEHIEVFSCAELSKVKKVVLAEKSTVVFLCDDQRIIFDQLVR